MKGKIKTLIVWVVLLGVFAMVFYVNGNPRPSTNVGFDTFRRMAEDGRVADVWIENNQITFRTRDGNERYATLGVIDADIEQALSDDGVVVQRGKESNWARGALQIGILVAVLLAVFYFLRKLRGRAGSAADIMSLRKSPARLVDDTCCVTFADVGGCAEAKELLSDVIDFLKNPKRWTDAGARLPRGVLLEGPPGCGKTLLARAVAGETNARFYLISACEFVEMFVGVGAARVRDLFETATKAAPAVIFIDELDAVGRRRGSGIGGGHDEREQTLNQLLVCLDGFHPNDRVVVLAATNRPDILDQALLRPGRIDRRIRVPELSCEARLEVLRIHTRNKHLAPEVSLEEWAGRTAGCNGAQLESLANEAALLAVRRSRNGDGLAVIGRADFERAMQPASVRSRLFDKLDALLIESTSQLAEPTGKARIRLILSEGAMVEGEVVWADAAFIKVRGVTDGTYVIVAKSQVIRIEVLEGTESADLQDVMPDAWAARRPDLA